MLEIWQPKSISRKNLHQKVYHLPSGQRYKYPHKHHDTPSKSSSAPLHTQKGSHWDPNGSRKQITSGRITPQRLSSKEHRSPKHRSSFDLGISGAWKTGPQFLPLPKEVRRKTLMWKAWLNFKEERMHSLKGWIFFEREKRSSCRRFMPTKEEGHFCY